MNNSTFNEDFIDDILNGAFRSTEFINPNLYTKSLADNHGTTTSTFKGTDLINPADNNGISDRHKPNHNQSYNLHQQPFKDISEKKYMDHEINNDNDNDNNIAMLYVTIENMLRQLIQSDGQLTVDHKSIIKYLSMEFTEEENLILKNLGDQYIDKENLILKNLIKELTKEKKLKLKNLVEIYDDEEKLFFKNLGKEYVDGENLILKILDEELAEKHILEDEQFARDLAEKFAIEENLIRNKELAKKINLIDQIYEDEQFARNLAKKFVVEEDSRGIHNDYYSI